MRDAVRTCELSPSDPHVMTLECFRAVTRAGHQAQSLHALHRPLGQAQPEAQEGWGSKPCTGHRSTVRHTAPSTQTRRLTLLKVTHGQGHIAE